MLEEEGDKLRERKAGHEDTLLPEGKEYLFCSFKTASQCKIRALLMMLYVKSMLKA